MKAESMPILKAPTQPTRSTVIDLPPEVPAFLQGGEVLSGFVSRHSMPAPRGSTRTWRENNPGIGFRHRSGFAGLLYVNSENRPTAILAYEEEILRKEGPHGMQSGLLLGAGGAVGYKDIPVAPVAYPAAFVGSGGFRMVVGHSPSTGNRIPSVTWVQVRYGFK